MKNVLIMVLVAASFFSLQAQAETPEQCAKKKEAFWRQTIRDCTRPDVNLFIGENSISRKVVATAIAVEGNSGPDGSHSPITGKISLAGTSYALEIEPYDILSVSCTTKAAFKHQVNFAYQRSGKTRELWMGTAEVFRAQDGSYLCTSIKNSERAEILLLK